jgi:membrane-anchored protein YejM (alkaline phosphatase superfamily)
MNLAILLDFFIFRIYKFHINSMILNIITSPEAIDAIELSAITKISFFVLLFLLFVFEIIIIYNLKRISESGFVKFINKKILIILFSIFFIEKISYGFFELFFKNNIISKFSTIPLYQPFTFNRFIVDNFDYNRRTSKHFISTGKLFYPTEDILMKKTPSTPNIFIFFSDAFRNSVISKEVTPNIENFKNDSIYFKNHYSGGNSTRFGLFSFFYGLNATYWFPFLEANKGPLFFNILKKLNYQINISSSTSTIWPEFAQTVFVDVQKSIKDDFKGTPYQKDIKNSKYFSNWISKQDKSKPIFSFVFLDAPHGHSYPKEFTKFRPDNKGDINYLTINSSDRDILFNQYKNAIYFNDKLFADMIKVLKTNNLYENSIIIFSSDHGEEFYEYGGYGHNNAFNKSQINSPLLIKIPNHKSKIVTKITSHQDIAPTLLTILGVANSTKSYSNGKNLLDDNYHRDFIFSSNWSSSAIVTKNYTQIYSNLPNEIFNNEVRDNEKYKITDKNIDKLLMLKIIQQNKLFLK